MTHRLPFLILLLLAGCGMEAKYASDHATRAPEAMNTTEMGDAGGSMDEEAVADEGKSIEAQRKIIYTANVDLVVEDFSDTPDKLKQLVNKHGGRIANSTLYAHAGSQQSGTWRVRVPVANFDAFLTDVRALGEVQSISTDSEEVTDQYYDLEKRIENKEVERDRLRGILADEKRVGKLKDVLDVEKRLAQVQGEIELAQGRMRRLKDRIAMTTVELSIQQIRDYVPPESASFGTLARRSLEQSWTALKNAGQTVVLGAIALAPWLPVILAGLLVVRFGWRRMRSKN